MRGLPYFGDDFERGIGALQLESFFWVALREWAFLKEHDDFGFCLLLTKVENVTNLTNLSG